MTLIPDEVIAEIRDRIDIVAVIGEHVQLRKAGVNHKGLCPFHHEKTPSFHVNPVRRSYTCFGCSRRGDVFSFLKEMQGKTFVEVVHDLAARAGVTVPERQQNPEEMARRSERGRLQDLNAVAATFFRQQLLGADGRGGRTYLASRGIGDVVAESFRLGLAPDAWDGLARHFEAGNHPLPLAVQLGLIAPRQKAAGFYDKFRNRLICPVILPAGEVVGFSGRALGNDPEAPKYTNSPESPVYKKSNLLFGIHAARSSWAKKGRAVLVEGNFDVIALHQAGFSETVAPLGTALTGEQVELLRRMAPTVIICLDGDSAGRAAALRAIPLLVHAGVETRVASLPDGQDPDSFVREKGPAVFEELLAHARPAIDHFLDEVWRKTDRSPERLAAALSEGAPLIAGIGDDVRRAIVIDQFALGMGVEPRIVRMAISRAAQPAGSSHGHGGASGTMAVTTQADRFRPRNRPFRCLPCQRRRSKFSRSCTITRIFSRKRKPSVCDPS